MSDCLNCGGVGELPRWPDLRPMGGFPHAEQEFYPCPDCDGRGEL